MSIASASSTVKIHDYQNGNIVYDYQPREVDGPIGSVSWSRNGLWMSFVPCSGYAEVVSFKNKPRLLKNLYEIKEPTSVSFHNTSKNLAIGTKNGSVLIYDVKSKNIVKKFPKTVATEVLHLAFTSTDSHCVAGCMNGDLLIYNNLTNSPPSNLRLLQNTYSISCIKTSMLKRHLVLSGTNDGNVTVWDINVKKIKFTVEAHQASINSLAFSPINSDLIITAGGDRQFSFYDIASKKCISDISVDNCITAVNFSPDGTYIVMGSQNGKIHIFDSRNIEKPVNSFVAHDTSVRHVSFYKAHETNSSESLLESVCSVDNVTDRKRFSTRTSDAFLVNPSPVEKHFSSSSVKGRDSFLVALGLDTTTESNESDNNVFIEENNSKVPECSSATLNSYRIDKLEPDVYEPIQYSTPKIVQTTPNCSTNQAPNSITNTEVKYAVQECDHEKFVSAINDLKKFIEHKSLHTTNHVRSLILGYQIDNMRRFLKLEEQSNQEVNNIDSLLVENKRLKEQIKFLENQLHFRHSSENNQD